MTEAYQYHEHPHKDVQFALAVQCFAHYCAVCSTRVYIGCITPNFKVEGSDKDKDES